MLIRATVATAVWEVIAKRRAARVVNSTLTSVAVSVVVVAVVALPHLRHVVGKIAQTMAAGIHLILRASR